jgi:hypothetical protein
MAGAAATARQCAYRTARRCIPPSGRRPFGFIDQPPPRSSPVSLPNGSDIRGRRQTTHGLRYQSRHASVPRRWKYIHGSCHQTGQNDAFSG